VSSRLTWADVTSAAGQLSPTDWRIERLLGLIPLVWPDALHVLTRLELATVYASLARLQELGLLEFMQPSSRPGRNPRLYHLTDLGVAVAAAAVGQRPRDFARRHRLRSIDLQCAVAGLPQLIKTYELLLDVARGTPGFQELADWRPPWPQPDVRKRTDESLILWRPALLRLRRPDSDATWLLVADTTGVPFAHHRSMLRRVRNSARRRRGPTPPLVIRTTDAARAGCWARDLEQLGCTRLMTVHLSWQGAAEPLPPPLLTTPASTGTAKTTPKHRAGTVVPPTVSATCHLPLAGAGRVAVDLVPTELRVLDVLARHPFLTVYELAAFTGSTRAEASARLLRLMNAQLVERLRLETPPPGCGALYEATVPGLHVAAARLGLSLEAAIRFCHLAGGGPNERVGGRRGLVRHLAHTHGVNATIAGFVATSRVTSRIDGDGLLRWQSEGEASDFGLRPDGYGVYQFERKRHEFFLEFDRGTMNRRDYERKIAAYYAYRQDDRPVGRYPNGFPQVLFVTTVERAEERFADAARQLARVHPEPLTIWLTTLGRVHAPDNRFGLIGRIWRQPDDHVDLRRRWPAEPARLLSRSA
jgi:predicted transcriptional regulator